MPQNSNFQNYRDVLASNCVAGITIPSFVRIGGKHAYLVSRVSNSNIRNLGASKSKEKEHERPYELSHERYSICSPSS